MSDAPSTARSGSVQSVDRAISVLQVLAGRGPSGVTEISRDLHIHKATVSRLLLTLEARGLVEQDQNRGRYRLGYGLVPLAQMANANHDIVGIGKVFADELAKSVRETVHIVARAGMEMVTIDQSIGSSTISVVNSIGHRDPLYPTAAGKVFLSDLSDTERRDLLAAHELVRYTPRTITDTSAYLVELDKTRDRGYGTSFEEMEVGLIAIAAPIRSLTGETQATLVISGPAFRLTESRVAEIAPRLVVSAAKISERNGMPKAG